MAAVHDQVKRLIARACGLQPGDVPNDARLGDTGGWDSLSHVALMVLIQETAGRPVGPAEMTRLTSLDEIAAWLEHERDEGMAVRAPSVDELAIALRRAGLAAGDLAMVHSFTAALGPVDRPDRLMIDALLQVLGPEGTLVLPAFTYSFCPTGLYGPDDSPSEVGIAADTLRLEYGAARTLHPVFSVCALGALADEIAHLHADTTFGAGSIFDYMLRRSGWLCAVGVGYEKVTLNHYPEERLEVPYRYWRTFDGVIDRDGEQRPVSVRYLVRSLAPEAVQDFSKVHRLMEGRPFSGHSTAGGADIWCAPAREYERVLRQAIQRDPLFLLTPAARVHWEQESDGATGDYVAQLRARLEAAPDDFEAACELAEVLTARGESEAPHRIITTAAVAAGDYASLTGACRVARELLPAEDDTATLTLAWTGSDTLRPVADACETCVRAAGWVPRTIVGDFGQFRRDLSASPLQPDIMFIRVAPEALVPGLSGWRFAGGDPEAAETAARKLTSAVEAWLATCPGHAVIHLVAPWHRSALGIADAEGGEGAGAVTARFNATLMELARATTRAHVLDEANAMLLAGAPATDPGLRYHAGIDLSGPAIAAVAAEASRFAVALRRRPAKCIVCDLDNTLWGGIVGEDGVRGLSLAGEYPGEAHLELQRWLIAQHQNGMLLGICSRNERSDGLAPFADRPDMLLTLDHFSAISIDWRPKPGRLAEVAAELNIGVDSLVFIDDSRFEREAVRAALPQVLAPELPDDVGRWTGLLADLHLTDALSVTDEDRRRAAMYAQDSHRDEELAHAADVAAFLSGLDSIATVYFDETALLPRSAQLCARTNQFNLSSARYTEGELEQMMLSPDLRVIQMRASDRFGDLGVVGVAIVARGDGDASVDTLLLSCRALGRGYEHALLAEAWRVASADFGAEALTARWADNGRNAQARDLLRDLGWEEIERDADAATFRCATPPRWPAHIRRTIA